MNANELADELDGFLKEQEQLPWGTKQVYLDQAATMLRQQQDKLTKYELRHAEQRKRIDELEAEIEALKSRELTDEEINDIAQQCWVYPQGEQAIFNQHKFAKAILRKAQE